MISQELRNLILSNYRDGHQTSEVHFSVKESCTLRAVQRVIRASKQKKPKRLRKKLTINKYRRMVQLLTISKAHIRSVAPTAENRQRDPEIPYANPGAQLLQENQAQSHSAEPERGSTEMCFLAPENLPKSRRFQDALR